MFLKAYGFLSILLALSMYADFRMLFENLPLVERHSCLETPHKTIAFDNSEDGNILYKYIFHKYFQELPNEPACTVGYDGEKVVVKIGDYYFQAKIKNRKVIQFKEVRVE